MYQPHWWVDLGNGQRLEFYRGLKWFNQERAGVQTTYQQVTFTQEVVSAEAFLSGFAMWYTREGHDHEVMRLLAHTRIDHIGPISTEFMTESEIALAKRSVMVKFDYEMTDEDTSDDDDFNNANIPFTIIALTKPLS